VGVAAIESLTAEIHRQEMAAVGFELRIAQADDAFARIGQKQELVALDARRARRRSPGSICGRPTRGLVGRLAEDNGRRRAARRGAAPALRGAGGARVRATASAMP